MMIPNRRFVVSALAFVLLSGWSLQAQEQLASARALYASAEYDNALEVLDRLSGATASPRERQEIDLYRTLCLFAVGRRTDADLAIEGMITRDPLYQPGNELPPRAQTAFNDAKRRLLPVIVQNQYAEAKTAFDRSEFQIAADIFRRVIDMLEHSDMGVAGRQPPLSDLRTLALGFHDLSVKSIPPPAPAPAAVPEPEPAPEPVAAPRTYTGDEAGVRMPVAIAQELPKYPGMVPAGGLRGIVEVIIDTQGQVEAAAIIEPLHGSVDDGVRALVNASAYHKLVLAAAKRWQFAPATFNGAPVPFRKRVQINIVPTAR
jgi:hypothetical protein